MKKAYFNKLKKSIKQMKGMESKPTLEMKYCFDCSFYTAGDVPWCKLLERFFPQKYHNEHFDCKHYKRKWWKFWVKKEVK